MSVRSREILWLICLCTVVAVPFLPTLGAQITNWDDDVNITGNPYVRAGVRDGLVPLLTRPYMRLYAPIPYAFFWAGYHIWGREPLVYHLVNLALHVAAAGLLYSIMRRMFSARWPALLGAAWWGVHPLNAEPVAWITGLKDVLSVAFVLLSWRLYIAWRERQASSGGASLRRAIFALSLLAFLIACLSKPSVVAFPVALAAWDLLVAGRRWRDLGPLGLFAVVGLLVAAMTVAIHRPEDAGVGRDQNLLARVAVAMDAAIFYFEKAIWPVRLCPVYGRSEADALRAPWPLLHAAILGAAVVIVWLMGQRWQFACVLFGAALLPVSGIVPFGYQAYSTVADRYAYLPLVGAAIVLSDLLARVEAADRKGFGQVRVAIRGAVAIWVGILGLIAAAQTLVWMDSVSLWERVIECNPRPTAAILANYGSALFQAGRNEEALEVLEQCARDYPHYARGRYNRARVLHALGRTDVAREECLAALDFDPAHVNAWVLLGAIEAGRGEYAACIAACQKALELKPDEATAALNLGLALLELNRPSEAVSALERAVRLQPNDCEARLHLASALERTGQTEEALIHLRKVLAAPGSAVAGEVRRAAEAAAQRLQSLRSR